MKRILFALAGLMLLASCQKEDGALTLSFRSTFQDQPLVLNQTYLIGELPIKFSNLTFYISDIAIENSKGELLSLKEAELVELDENAYEGYLIEIDALPADNYTKLKFNIGLPEDLNAKTPEDYEIGTDLGRSDHFWEAWGSYIFSKTEGKADPDGDGVFDLNWFYHTGSDALNRTIEMETEIVIDEEGNTIMDFVLDYDKLLRNEDGTPFDIEAMPRNHNPERLELITALVNNYVEALKVRS